MLPGASVDSGCPGFVVSGSDRVHEAVPKHLGLRPCWRVPLRGVWRSVIILCVGVSAPVFLFSACPHFPHPLLPEGSVPNHPFLLPPLCQGPGPESLGRGSPRYLRKWGSLHSVP